MTEPTSPAPTSPAAALNAHAAPTDAAPAQKALTKIVAALDHYHNEIACHHHEGNAANHLITTLGLALHMPRELGMTQPGGKLENRYNDFMVHDLGGEPRLVLLRQAMWDYYHDLDWNQSCHRATAKLIRATGQIMQHSRASDVHPVPPERPTI